MAVVFLGLGSNLGDREANIRTAIDRLNRSPVIRVVKVSSLYESAPMGEPDQPDFLNAVAQVEADLEPADVMEEVIRIETEQGRTREHRWGPRTIDIDILLYDEVSIVTDGLTIPHPRMMERAFVMAPLAEIAPGLKLSDGRTACDVLKGLRDQSVRKLSEVE